MLHINKKSLAALLLCSALVPVTASAKEVWPDGSTAWFSYELQDAREKNEFALAKEVKGKTLPVYATVKAVQMHRYPINDGRQQLPTLICSDLFYAGLVEETAADLAAIQPGDEAMLLCKDITWSPISLGGNCKIVVLRHPSKDGKDAYYIDRPVIQKMSQSAAGGQK